MCLANWPLPLTLHTMQLAPVRLGGGGARCRGRRVGVQLVLLLATLLAMQTALAQAPLAQELRQRHADLSQALARSAFGRPLLLQSQHGRDTDEGVVEAVLDAPLDRVQALASPQRWCDVLMLHQTTHRCRVAPDGRQLDVQLSNKSGLGGQLLNLRLNFEASVFKGELLTVRLEAAQGPLGSREYRIRLEATALPSGQSFMRFRYSYGFGLLARLAMQGYLSTRAQEKIGFSLESGPGGSLQPVRGMRGVIERNTLRYFLAIEVLLHTLELPPAQLERRLLAWFDATEQYARQLHELDRAEYLALKRRQLGLDPRGSVQ